MKTVTFTDHQYFVFMLVMAMCRGSESHLGLFTGPQKRGFNQIVEKIQVELRKNPGDTIVIVNNKPVRKAMEVEE